MTDARHARIREIFLGACERPAPARALFLDHECAGDPALRREVEGLLRHHDEANRSAPEAPDEPRFRPGDLFADRYRIVSLLGEGGMGQVYRAEDETLQVPVAVKLLPERQDLLRRRLLDEVRLAREITHSSICRVHDVGEWNGEIFITMEYVAGEDLASLLRRIGRMPADKVVEIARSLGAGLAAAHAQGVLHRDLKPANVLIDPDGRVCIADFGIAVGRRERARGHRPAGTPAYMAPELFQTDRRASEKSDLYALGALLYELATGRLPSDRPASSRRALPRAPSELVPGLDPRLEQAILSCLAPDPEDRPDSALAFVGRLPGGDPLGLAAEVDVTPSPDLVASADDQPLMSSSGLIAVWIVGCLLAVAALGLADLTLEERRAGWFKPPANLAEDARDILESLGHEIDGSPSFGYLDDPTPNRWQDSILFWWSTSTERRVPTPTLRYLYARPLEPLPSVPGQTTVLLDLESRLVYLQADPVASDDPSPTPWDRLLALIHDGGIEELVTTRAEFLPPGPADELRAWSGQRSDGTPVRLQAAAVAGRITYVGLQDGAPGALFDDFQTQGNQASWVRIFLWLIMLTAIPLAWLNLRRRRVDRQGARRLAWTVVATLIFAWMLLWGRPPHPATDLGLALTERLIILLFGGGWLWLGYLALEPYVRRIWPRTLTAWSRALRGRASDPLVGQSLVVGITAGFAFCTLGYLDYWVPSQLGLADPILPQAAATLRAVLGPRMALSTMALSLSPAIFDGLITLLIFVLCRRVLKRRNLATLAFIALFGSMVSLTGGGNLWISWLVQGLPAAILAAWLMIRLGLLAYVAARYVFYLLETLPLTLNAELWYSEAVYMVLALLIATAALGLRWALNPTRAPATAHYC